MHVCINSFTSSTHQAFMADDWSLTQHNLISSTNLASKTQNPMVHAGFLSVLWLQHDYNRVTSCYFHLFIPCSLSCLEEWFQWLYILVYGDDNVTKYFALYDRN